MSIKAKLAEDLKAAMRAKDAVLLDTIRSVRAAITQREVDGGKDLDEAAVFDVIRGLRKQNHRGARFFYAVFWSGSSRQRLFPDTALTNTGARRADQRAFGRNPRRNPCEN